MTSVRTAPARPSALSAHRVGPVITTVASVVGAVIMFGLGVLLGRVGASVLGLHGAGRTGVMLGTAVVLGFSSIVTSARRHLPRRR
ncbi:MAG: hypothetical protein QOE76_169 [Frankiales bacterium]|jgi:hypothetical protein|nr:hypothetical protein [Frankiales bacterium]MDX6242446.1 hypothetical protein [Frankiales bacterium]